MYTIYNKSQALSSHTAYKLQATSIMREGLEAVMNIRATNWMNFSADTEHCWNVANYNVFSGGENCLLVEKEADSNAVRIQEGSYILVQEYDVPRWKLEPKTEGDYGSSYVEQFRIKKNDTGFWEQGFTDITDYMLPAFTREIQIKYHSSWTDPDCNDDSAVQQLCSEFKNPQKMMVKSIVQWVDSTKSEPHKLESEIVLTNRK